MPEFAQISRYAGAKARALAITKELQQRDEALRELLSYCRQHATTAFEPVGAARIAHQVVADKLAAIVDGHHVGPAEPRYLEVLDEHERTDH